MNEILPQKTWLQRNKKKCYAAVLLVFAVLVVFVVSGGKENISNYMEIYSNPEVYQNAVTQANKNPRVLEILGKLQPIDNLAVAEGNAVYSNGNATFEMTARIQGEKRKGKIRILAEKQHNSWRYTTITIHVKDPDETIPVTVP